MALSRHLRFYARASALWGGMGLAMLLLGFAAAGFFIAAFYIWLAAHLAPVQAALVTGAALLALALALGLIGGAVLRAARARERARLAEFSLTLGTVLRLAAYLVRRDPKKAMIFALIAGALAEFFTGET
ncbi:hypothetical protein [Acidocella sp.]|uniref:hypothetical protein n=1 Tax=Acidocella sp. TaxID=50710 RepID=UPI0026019591|nr:hypothetical protein [Acidocella sp.]MDD2795217.1 hypothetical protein [Acidocella sp.]